ncbi:MAG: ribonuclease Z [Alloprevotella sp.]|nr:ribonuclease Z [Alloprevotella sp.]
MEKFELTILGCGSAKPTLRHNPACQALTLRGRLYLIDCGEGAQQAAMRFQVPLSRLEAVFLSHLHGDHCLGLPGLLCTLSLHKRQQPLDVYGPKGLEMWLRPTLNFYAGAIDYDVRLHELTSEGTCYEDSGLSVNNIALDHRVACYGYVFTERQGLPHIRRDMIDYLHIPFHAIRAIKEGAGWERPDGGGFVPHERLVTPADAPRSYAYLSDTRPLPTLADKIAPPTLLYHEATYTELHAADAALRYHSTARGAATVAQALCAQQLLIGHFSSRYEKDEQPILDEARALFPNTRLANEGLRLTL